MLLRTDHGIALGRNQASQFVHLSELHVRFGAFVEAQQITSVGSAVGGSAGRTGLPLRYQLFEPTFVGERDFFVFGDGS